MKDSRSGHPQGAAFDLLLACADWPADSERDARIRAAHKAFAGDWTTFGELLDRHRMTALAVRALQGTGIEVPVEFAKRASLQQRRAMAMTALSIRLTEQLAEANIEAMLLKGALLSQMLYGDPTIRQSVDIDILVDWRDFDRAIAALEGHGLRLQDRRPPFADWRIELWRKLAKDVTLIHPDEGVAVELHHRLKTPDTLLPGLGLAQASERESLANAQFAAFSRENLFVYLCAHASTTQWHRLKWVTDIHVMLGGMTIDEIERWQSHSASLGTQRCTALGLLLVHDLWGRTIPQSVHDAVRGDKALAALLTASRERLFGPERAYTSLSNTLARRNLMRLRTDKAYRQSLLLELRHDRELLERFRISESLRWLYLPLRAALFVQRKLSRT